MAKQSSCIGALLALPMLVLGVTDLLAQQPVGRDTIEVVPIAPVTVTVLRTPLQMEQVPYAVSVTTEESIQRGKPGISVEEALRVIPGVQVDNRYNYALGERLTIRGFGARSQFGVRGVRILVDGIPATLPDGQSSMTHVDPKSLGRVEVIRGPAASLYGNTAGGVIQMEMQRPPPFPVSQEFSMVGGANGLLRLQSSTGGQTGATSYQLNATRLTYEGYRPNSSTTNLYLNGRLGYDTARDRVRVTLYAGDSDALSPGSLTEQQRDENPFQTLPLFLERQTGKTVRESMLGGSWARSGGPLATELSAYVGTRDLVNPIIPTIIEFDRLGGGVRALAHTNPLGALGLQLSFGAEADQQRDDRRNFANDAGERGAVTLDQIDRVRNLGLLGQLSARPLPRVSVMGGLRYDWFEFSADDRLITATNPDDSGTRTMDAISPSAGVTFVITPDLHVYGNVGTTFETPTTTELANRPDGAGGINPELEPQRATSYEVGGRTEVGTLAALQLSIYRARIRNALVPFGVPEVPGRSFFRNAARATHQGVEFGATVVPASGLTFQTAYTYTDAVFDEYLDRTGVSHAGNAVPGVAPHRLESTLTLAPRPRSWYAAVEHRFVGEHAVNDAGTSHSPAYHLVELRGGVEGIRVGAVTLDPFAGISNLFDTSYNAAVTVNDANARFFEPGPGRAFYAGGSVRLDAR